MSLSSSLGLANTPYVTRVESRCLAYRVQPVQVLPRRFTAYGYGYLYQASYNSTSEGYGYPCLQKGCLVFLFQDLLNKMSPATKGDYYLYISRLFPGTRIRSLGVVSFFLRVYLGTDGRLSRKKPTCRFRVTDLGFTDFLSFPYLKT